jgi:putative ABC transport system ATP-binding protein
MILECRNVEKSFSTSQKIVHIAEFKLNQNSQIAIRGESGSGKSTFLNLCAGLLTADKGEILLHGENITNLSEPQRDQMRARHIGYLHQQFLLLHGFTAIENLIIPMQLAGKEDIPFAQNLLKELGIDKHRNSTPSQMSIGERQRLALARALVNKPSLVLADEPTASLDEKNSESAIKLLQDLCAEYETSLIVVTHERSIWDKFQNKREWEEINR